MSKEPSSKKPTKQGDWLDTLIEIRQQDKAKHESQAKAGNLDLSVISQQNQAASLLRICDAHRLLRRVQSVLLEGKGIIDVFDRTTEYEQAIALVWQGPVSKARIPNPQDPEPYQYILVGATSSKVYVNNRVLEFITPEALKEALAWAAQNPLKWLSQDKTGKVNK